MDRRTWMAATLGSLASMQAPRVWAAAYPERPIRMIVTHQAGSSPDVFARALGTEMNSRTGQAVVIENIPGGGGLIGTTALKRAAPDGYTLGILGNTQAINMHSYRNQPYDLAKDFTPVTLTSSGATVLVVPSASPLRGPAELVQKIRQQPGALNYGSSGKGSISHLGTEALLHQHGLSSRSVVDIPYKGGPEMVTALVSGEVQFGMPVLSSALSYIRSGQLRALAIVGSSRSRLLPDVPTLAELLPPGVVLDNWAGLFGPANLAPALQQRLFTLVGGILADGSLEALADKQGGEIRRSASSAEFNAFIRVEIERYAKWVRTIGLGGRD